ncbi:MAG: hypothetical protein M3Q07_04225, partial [Pseudobdellovibrionaceae bacterium]|nr:hypothetical protein [Pseudobdellovibrionaceae bacterium]
NGNVNALGLFDMDRKIRPVGLAYKQLIDDWCKVLPTQSVCLKVPVVPPKFYKTPWWEHNRLKAIEDLYSNTDAPANTNA